MIQLRSAIATLSFSSARARSAPSGFVATMYEATPMFRRASGRESSSCPTLAHSATNFARTLPLSVRTVTVAPCSTLRDAAVLVQAHARGDRGPADPECEAQRMQVARAAVEQSREVALARDPLAHFVPFHEAEQAIAVVAFLLALPFEQLLALARLDADVHVAPDEVAVDAVLRDQVARQADGLDADVPQPLRIGLAELRGELRHAAGIAGNDLAAGAPGGAVADAVGLEQHDLVAALGQVQRGRAAGEPGAHDADVRLDVALERRRGGAAAGGRLVPAVGGPQDHTCSRYQL